MMSHNFKSVKKSITGALIAVALASGSAFAAPSVDADIDSLIQQQQQVLVDLNHKKNDQKNKEMMDKIDQLEKKLGKFDNQGAINSLADQINDIRAQLKQQAETQKQLMEILTKLTDAEKERKSESIATSDEGFSSRARRTRGNKFERSIQDISYEDATYDAPAGNVGGAASRKFLVNPGTADYNYGTGESVSYTQDAVNSQGNSTMVFRYSPSQLYKIYCRRGFVTDISFKKGETLTYVGGGDTSGWAVSNTTVDGTPHLFIKPVVETSTTNLIVTTDKRTYQLILNTSDWYNPMIKWSYDIEDYNNNLIQQRKDEKTITGNVGVSNIERLNFDYEVSGNGNKPVRVFDDGQKTYIQFSHLDGRQYPLFVRGVGKKEMSLINYKVKDNCYIIDRVFDLAQIRESDTDIVSIKRKK